MARGSTHLLFDVEDRNMSRNRHLSAREGPEQCRFTNTVVTNETITVAVG